MNEDDRPDWQVRLANLRANSSNYGPPKPASQQQMVSGDLSSEALMTIVAIMKDNDDPKLQMAAAKMVLEKSAKGAALLPAYAAAQAMTKSSEPVSPTSDDIDAAIALAKAILDELAGRKTQKLDGAGAVVINSTAGTDNPAR